MLSLFLKGLIFGFAIAAPVGPIGVLCIQRSLHDGFKVGFMTGIGAALADGVYGLIAGLGLTAISSFLVAEQFWIRLLGGCFLIYLGLKIILSKSDKKTHANPSEKSPWHACVVTFFLTLTNPMTILSFIAIFSGLGLMNSSTDYTNAFYLVAGITLGSASWWLLLSSSVSFALHHRLNPNTLRMINILSGIIMVAFGIIAFSMNNLK